MFLAICISDQTLRPRSLVVGNFSFKHDPSSLLFVYELRIRMAHRGMRNMVPKIDGKQCVPSLEEAG
jgi:hypothetical protein